MKSYIILFGLIILSQSFPTSGQAAYIEKAPGLKGCKLFLRNFRNPRQWQIWPNDVSNIGKYVVVRGIRPVKESFPPGHFPVPKFLYNKSTPITFVDPVGKKQVKGYEFDGDTKWIYEGFVIAEGPDYLAIYYSADNPLDLTQVPAPRDRVYVYTTSGAKPDFFNLPPAVIDGRYNLRKIRGNMDEYSHLFFSAVGVPLDQNSVQKFVSVRRKLLGLEK